MASGPITSWPIDGEKVETAPYFLYLGSTITANNDYSHEMKRSLLLGKKAITNLDNVLENKDIKLCQQRSIIVKASFSRSRV